jgi:DNA modification methylase
MGRTCVAVEKDAAYCDVIIERWQILTGGAATR